jgi:hypothetical protein
MNNRDSLDASRHSSTSIGLTLIAKSRTISINRPVTCRESNFPSGFLSRSSTFFPANPLVNDIQCKQRLERKCSICPPICTGANYSSRLQVFSKIANIESVLTGENQTRILTVTHGYVVNNGRYGSDGDVIWKKSSTNSRLQLTDFRFRICPFAVFLRPIMF